MKVYSLVLALCGLLYAAAAADLEQTFKTPPQSAKPWSYWFWINGNITKEGITADLEAMNRVGIGGVLIMEVGDRRIFAPEGPVPFASAAWRELFSHMLSESKRLGMEVSMNNDAGWCGSGGPWVTPEFSMQKLVVTNSVQQGGRSVRCTLPQPHSLSNYYKDVKVLAVPASKGKGSALSKAEILDISDRMDREGNLAWEAPAGEWNILRIGVTTTGAVNKPSPKSGEGLECDKFNPEAIKRHFNAFIGKLAADNPRLTGKTFTMTHIDSWEVGGQDWTPRMAEEFRSRRGYDLIPWLPVLVTGATVGSPEETERFKWDFRRTQAELNVDYYAQALKDISHKHKLKLSIEAYNGNGFLDPLVYGGVADVPMSEFWIWRWGGWHVLSSKLLASAGHVYGRRIIGAESFTSWPAADQYSEHPYSVKTIGDWAFSEGVNRIVFHRTVHDPWTNHVPGMSFGGFGWHVDRNQTWFEQSAAYMRYLARCQTLLQQGRFVADVCRLVPVGENFGDRPGMRTLPKQYDPLPAGYNYDYIPDKLLLQEVSVVKGRLVTRSGMSYSMLQCPNSRTLTPELTRKLRDLVAAGAIIYGPSPTNSPSLSGFPACDRDVQKLSAEAWGNCDGESVVEHQFGQGRVFWGKPLEEVLQSVARGPDFTFFIDPPATEDSVKSITQGLGLDRPGEPASLMPTTGMNWLHRRIGKTEVYFVANPQHRDIKALCTFRVEGRAPEIWNPETGETQPARIFRQEGESVQVPLNFQPSGSLFVIFREKPRASEQIVRVERNGEVLFGQGTSGPARLPVIKAARRGEWVASGEPGRYNLQFANGNRSSFELRPSVVPVVLTNSWTVAFQPGRGAPERIGLPELVDWSKHQNEGVRHFSGTATYKTRFSWTAGSLDQRCVLDLGNVQVIAEVTLNGKELGVFWKPPFTVDVTESLKPGENELEVKVTNLWPNRLIGDEQFPDDCTPNGRWKTGALPAWPEWYLKGKPRPEQRRVTFSTWKYYTKDSPLVESGLLGPVQIRFVKQQGF